MQRGFVVDGRFIVEERAAAGGMGTIYRALDQETGSFVAIKVLSVLGPTEEARFLCETKVLLSLSYPSIVGCIGHGVLPDGAPFLVMEWVEGEDLGVRLQRGPLSVTDALLVTQAIAGALHAAHQRGIVHRDVKPGNIILEGGNPARARLIDFGLARIQNSHQATQTGALLGTPSYIAPEQIRSAHSVDGRADLYALGVILFEGLTGRRPFVSHDDVLGVITQALFEPAPHICDINPMLPLALDNLVDSLLEKDPDKRLGSAQVLIDKIASLELESTSLFSVSRVKPTGLTDEELRFVSVVLLLPTPSGGGAALDDMILAQPLRKLVPAIERVVAPFSGRVEGVGDGRVLVAFAGRGAATDQAAAAARAALAIRDLGTGTPIALTTGRGSALAGSLYSDAAIRAAALAKVCPPGEVTIAVDETTRGLLDPRFAVEQRGEAFFLVAEDPFGEAGRLLCGRLAPFVGRERELNLVEQVFGDVHSESHSAVILIAGEAGSGKSRLGREVLGAISRIEPTTEIWVGRADIVSAGSPFGMLARALQRAMGIHDGEPSELRYQKLVRFVAEHVAPERVATIVTFLGEVVDARAVDEPASIELRAARRDAVLMGDRIRLAFEDLVDAITQKRPLVFLLEDLHWGDIPTVKLLDLTLRNLRSRPFLLIALGRPEMAENFPGLFADRSPHSIRLGALSRKACFQLVRRVLGDSFADKSLASLVERSAGHALFLEELVRAVAESHSSSITILPETLLAMVQSRVEKLPTEARRVLRAASVFGETFWHGGVGALLGPTFSKQETDGWLGVLFDREMIEAKRESRFPSEREYTFRHALFREAAYSMLTDADRLVGHSLAGAFLEACGEKNASLLAFHFDNANEPVRAATYHVRASREALLGADLDAVLRHVEKVVASGVTGVILGEALATRAEVMQWRGAYEQAAIDAEAAYALLTPGSATSFEAMATLAITSGRRLDHLRIQSLCNTLKTFVERNESSDAFIETAVRTGFQAYIAGQYEAALDLMAAVQPMLLTNTKTEPRTQAFVKILDASQANIEWKFDKVADEFLRSAELFEQSGDQRSACSQRIDACFFLIDLGQGEKVIMLCEQLNVISERLGLQRIRTSTRLMHGSALLALGRYDEALLLLLAVKPELDALGDQRLGATVRTKLGRCYRHRGDYAEAKKMLEESGLANAGLARLSAICCANLALLAIDMNDADEALRYATLAMDLFKKMLRIGTDEILLRYAYVMSLRKSGLTQEADVELQIAKERLLWMAEKLTTQEAKHLFLTNIDENRRVLAL